MTRQETRSEQRARIESKDYLDGIFIYDPDSGLLYRKSAPSKPAGYRDAVHNGYVGITIERVKFRVHRLAWAMMTGARVPSSYFVDHIDGNRSNNKWSNLRIATIQQSAGNTKTRKSNKLGVKGVSVFANKYRAAIVFNGKQRHLGLFNTLDEAKDAHDKAAVDLFGEFACNDR